MNRQELPTLFAAVLSGDMPLEIFADVVQDCGFPPIKEGYSYLSSQTLDGCIRNLSYCSCLICRQSAIKMVKDELVLSSLNK